MFIIETFGCQAMKPARAMLPFAFRIVGITIPHDQIRELVHDNDALAVQLCEGVVLDESEFDSIQGYGVKTIPGNCGCHECHKLAELRALPAEAFPTPREAAIALWGDHQTGPAASAAGPDSG